MYSFNIILTNLCNAHCSHCYMKTNEKLHGLKKSEDKWLCSMMWAIGFVLFVMLLSAFFIFKCINDWDHRGQFGDLF